jgi:cytochrome c
MKRSLLLTIIVLLLPACGGTQAADVPPTLNNLQVRGQREFESTCSRCHSRLEGEVVVGPSLNGIASHAGERVDGLDAEAYIRQSIAEPNAYVVEGFQEGLMPAALADELEPDEIDAIVAYLLTLK